jgi:hypothetical protein
VSQFLCDLEACQNTMSNHRLKFFFTVIFQILFKLDVSKSNQLTQEPILLLENFAGRMSSRNAYHELPDCPSFIPFPHNNPAETFQVHSICICILMLFLWVHEWMKQEQYCVTRLIHRQFLESTPIYTP